MNHKLMKWNPTKELWVVLLSWMLVVLTFYISFQVITIQRVAAQFVTFGIIGIAMFGVFLPVVWTLFVMKRPLASLGIKKDKLAVSIGLCFIFSVVQYYLTLSKMILPDLHELVPLGAMALAVGFYENIFYRGWVQLKMEEFFGIIPGIFLSALIYSLYHVGYGMPADELPVLFIIGLVYSSLFRLTSNIFILYPLLTPMGALFTQIRDQLVIPFEATYGFLDVILLIVIGLAILSRRKEKKDVRI
ncbi:CPBP family intramembrane glutamic endopeptidase [Sinanaerobacter chloroacetimidivorans]|jgi:membrane protease YdiL (CAAX protease family)|uniref:CPBP family intramembrane metalloprotease n=1 Tax=Sinanaerobacter chloroacetimidivorans TaxID=2818044 RepID=A0A8J7W7M5_9FIRM|nr:type II CAAX endopeptidase family protein [Sinanaerobacter chloroacetimidivorans]MBR0600615.1 CPBP family intramembrane metalloprotease [Sinanaerobacter chloroacetimidivorans]